MFVPENGAWGRQGCTRVRLDDVDEDTVGEAMTLAWQTAMSLKSKVGSLKRSRKVEALKRSRKREDRRRSSKS